MDNKYLRNYAALIARKGVNVQKGDEVIVNAELDQPDFVTMVVEECYKAGAKAVEVRWNHGPIGKLHYKYMTTSNLSKVSPVAIARYKYMVKKLPSMIHIVSDDPDGMKGVNQAKVAKSRAKSYPKIKKYRDAMDGKYKWVIAAVPGVKWARKVFPGCSDEEAVEKLWNAILLTSRVLEGDAVENWNKHNEFLIAQRKKLEALRLVKLIYKASNGTDFEVEIDPNMLWGGGVEVAPNKGEFNPNIPSEEVFTTPIAGKCEGTLVASKPLSYMGELIEDFSITFTNGKVSAVKARRNQSLLEHMVSMDEGASMLGEVALVPYDSPIRESGVLFYETLFDENAACHVALGAGFRDVLPNSEDMTPEEVKAHGVNDSMIHVDFMIGTKDLSITGISEDGKVTQIFKDGNWAI